MTDLPSFPRRHRRMPNSPAHRLRRMKHGRSTRAADSRIPPEPPLQPTPVMACSPLTDYDVLWAIAREYPELRRWIVANPNADAPLLEFISQQGGPHVREALQILLESLG